MLSPLVGENQVTISSRPSRASQLRVLSAIGLAAVNSKAIRIPEGGRRYPLTLLIMVALCEEEGRPLNVDGLRTALRLTQASASRQVAALVHAGAIETKTDPSDARKTIICLTECGNQFIDEVLAAMATQVIAERERQAADEN